MEITVLGHAGLHLRTRYGTVLCDPWTNPTFFASWFPFPDNSWLDWDRYGDVDVLYLSHLHRDHFDVKNLSEHVSKSATVLLPDYPTDDLQQQLEHLGFRSFRRVPKGQLVEHEGLRILIEPLTAPNDGAVGDSALALSDGAACVLNQNDAKLTDFTQVCEFGPYDIHFLQFSGANWWPWVYTLPDNAKRAFGAAKRSNGLSRALRFVEAVGARRVVPFAGPPCFLDEDLFQYNDLHNSDWNTFPDQAVVLDFLRDHGVHNGLLTVPGTTIDVTGRGFAVVHPAPEAEILRPFTDKTRYLQEYAHRERVRIVAERADWPAKRIDVLSELKSWFEPLMASADYIATGIGGPVLIKIVDDESLVIDFGSREVRRHDGEKCRYVFSIDRPILQKLIRDREVDWINSLFLSMRFTASRIGPFNEFVYAFFTCLSKERMEYADRYYAEEEATGGDFQIGQWRVPIRCPHRKADLSQFGELDGEVLTCQMHGWQFNLATGRCLTSAAHKINAVPVEPN
jgi:UDP-MurNAc hydroxylase